MPSITDLKKIKRTNKIFEKKEYRPWDEKVSNPISGNNVPKTVRKSSTQPIGLVKLEKIWRDLYGAKKILLKIILQNIEEVHDSYLITNSITTDLLVSESSLPTNTIKAAIQQLKNDSLIMNYETKPGKGGFARYRIPKHVYEYFTEKYSITNQ